MLIGYPNKVPPAPAEIGTGLNIGLPVEALTNPTTSFRAPRGIYHSGLNPRSNSGP